MERNGSEWTKNLPVWIAITFVAPAALLGFAGWWVWDEVGFRSRAVEAQGRVVEVERRADPGEGMMYLPTVEFADEDGRTRRHTPAAWSSEPYTENQGVDVRYDPDAPSDVRIGGSIVVWVVPAAAGVIGLAALAVGVGSKLGYAMPGGSHADVPLHHR